MQASITIRKILTALLWLSITVLADYFLFLFKGLPVIRLFFVSAVILWYQLGRRMIIPTLILSAAFWFFTMPSIMGEDAWRFLFIPLTDLFAVYIAKTLILRISHKGTISLFSLPVIFRFFFLAALIPSLVQVILFFSVLYLNQGTLPLVTDVLGLYFSDYLALVLIYPLYYTRRYSDDPFAVTHRLSEYLIIAVLLIGGSFLIFSNLINAPLINITLAYLITPVFIWLSGRFNTREVAVLLVITVLLSVVFSINPGNPVLTTLLPFPFLILQIYFSIVLLIAWLIHILFLEREERLNEITLKEKELTSIFENVPVPFVVTDNSFRILRLNAEFSGFLRDLGLPLKEYLYQIPGLVPEGVKGENTLRSWLIDVPGEGTLEKEIGLNDSEGNKRLILLRIRRNVRGFLAGFRDITEERDLLERISQSERRLQNLVQNLQGMVFQSDYSRPGRLKFASEGCFRLTGYLPSEFMGEEGVSFNSLVSEDYQVVIRQKMEMAVKKGDFYEVQYPLITRSGEKKWVNEKGIGLYDTEGRLDSVEGIIVDISDRMDILNSLRISEQRFRSLFDNIPVVLWEMDFRKIRVFLDSIVKESPDLTEYFRNYPEATQQLIKKMKVLDSNQTALDFFMVNTRKEAMEKFRSYFEQGVSDYLPEALSFLHKGHSHADNFYAEFSFEGRRKYVYLTWHILPEAKSDWSRVVLSIIDVSKLREAQKEIIKLNEGLEEKVRQRTEELKQANKDLEAFSYSVSHDLKAPLRAIKGFGRMLEENEKESLSEKGGHYLKMIRENVDNMNELITSLLKFSRLGRKSMKIINFSPSEMVEELWQEIMQQQGADKARITINPLPDVQADPALLRQVFYNLLSNAIKFSDQEEHPMIDVSCRRQNSSYEFCVKDNGIGFEQRFEDKIFKVFQRLHTSKEYEGTGIGLALVQRIIRLHRGTITAKSAPGEGAAFYFTLPVEIHSE